MSPKVFLDLCCVSRFTDDQSQLRVRQETEALEVVLALIRERKILLVSSDALLEEAQQHPDSRRRQEAVALLHVASEIVRTTAATHHRAEALSHLGYGDFDALHIAAAESVSAVVLLTTDDRLIKRVARGLGNVRIPVQNPVSWIKGIA